MPNSLNRDVASRSARIWLAGIDRFMVGEVSHGLARSVVKTRSPVRRSLEEGLLVVAVPLATGA